MSLFEDIKILALRDVIKSTPEYRLNHVYRWYSKTFHTPLHIVYSLQLHDIVKAFFEERFEGMSEEDLEEARQELLMSEEEKMLAQASNAKEEAELDSLMVEAAKKQTNKVTENVIVKNNKEIVNLPTFSEKDMEKLPENIKIEFVDEKFFDDLDKDDEPVGLFDKKKQS